MNYDYKINMDKKNSAHTQCIELIKPNSKVLDLGCAVGALGEYLHHNKKCEVIGVDYLEEFIIFCETKKCYKKLFQIDLNGSIDKLDEYNNYFDYILLADVIEHLYNPKEVLEKLKPLLKQQGSFILSIPNIAHATTKINLLNNDFKYTEYGLLDKTHIRFFTKNSIIDLMNELNLNIINDGLILAPFSTCYEPTKLSDYSHSILNLISSNYQSFVYQYILEVSREGKNNNIKRLSPNQNQLQEIKKMKSKIKLKHFFRGLLNKW